MFAVRFYRGAPRAPGLTRAIMFQGRTAVRPYNW